MKSKAFPAVNLCAFLLLCAFAGQGLWSMRQQTVTIDEYRHLPTGLYYLRTGDFSFDCETPPLFKMAWALPAQLMGAKLDLDPNWRQGPGGWWPWILGTRFMLDNAARYDNLYFRAQCMTLLAAISLGILIFVWAKMLYGGRPALFSLLLFSFSPTAIAHSRLVTTDIGAALFMALTVFLLWRYLKNPTRTRLAGMSAALSLAVLTKFTAILLLPLLPLGLFLKGRRPLPTLLTCALVLSLVCVAVNVQYGFQGFGRPLRSFDFQSRSFQRLQVWPLSAIALPLPAPFLEGIDGQKADVETSEFPAFLNGEWSRDGWWYYFLAAFLMKEPIAWLCLLAGLLILPRQGHRLERWESACFWFIPAALLVLLSFFNQINVGLRYLLPAYPFLWIACARLAASPLLEKRWYRCALILLGAWSVTAPFKVAPHYMAYFNELAGGPGNGYRHLIDSNLDHGQDLKYLKSYMTQNGIKKVQLAYFGHVWPQMYGIDFEPLGQIPKPGTVAISASLLQGQPYLLTYLPALTKVPQGYFQALKKYAPRAQIGHSIFIYDIPAE